MFNLTEENLFDPNDINYHKLIITGYLDPSLEVGSSQDDKAFVTIGFDEESGIYYELDSFIDKMSFSDCIHMMFIKFDHFEHNLIGIEDNFFQRLILDEIRHFEERRNNKLPIIGITNIIPKEARIAQLEELINNNKIKFNKDDPFHKKLIHQLLRFPSKHSKNDGPDALAGSIKVNKKYLKIKEDL